jgi:isopenicillin-N N-acyltransferase-like protein
MTFPVHRSTERSPQARGEAFGRAQAEPIGRTLALYERMFDETGVTVPDALPIPDAAAQEIEAIARGAHVDPHQLKAVNARTEILAGHGPTECSVVGAGGLLAQNWDWHPESATVIQIVEHDKGWFVTLTEAGILAKIGLNDAGLGVCLNLLRSTADGGCTGTAIHVLLRQTLETCRTVDEAIDLLGGAQTSASSAVTVATPGDVATLELSPGDANVIRGIVGAHTNHFLEPPRAGEDAMDSESTIPRLRTIRDEPLLDALRSHDGHPQSVCRHLDPGEPWAEQTVTVASVVMNLAKLRFHVAAGHPCTHEHVQIDLPVAAHA